MSHFERVYWLSGSPCGGKTTVSDLLAKRFNWNVYHVDEHWDSHKARAKPEQHPNYYSITRVTGDALWLRPLKEQIATEPLFISEAFTLICEDIEQILQQDARPLIVDASVIPSNVELKLPSKNHIFYLIPSEQFQRAQYAMRPSIKPTLAKTTNPELAWSNWMARDAAYARWLSDQVVKYALPHIVVDGSLSLDCTIDLIANHYIGYDKK